MTDYDKKLYATIAAIAMEQPGRDPMAGYGYGKSPYADTVKSWESGLAGQIPSSLQHFIEEAKKRLDPEWGEHVRLKRKFGK